MAMNHRVAAGIGLISLAGILWGAMGTAVQFLFQVAHGFNPLDLVALRQICAGTLFVCAAFCVQPRKMLAVFRTRRLLLDVFFSGVLIFTTHFCFFAAIFYSNAGTGAVFLTLVPLLCAAWLALTKKEPITRVEMICSVLAIAGVTLIVTDGDLGSLQFSPLAIVFGLGSTVLAATYNIQPLRAIREVGVVPVLSWGMLTGGFCGLIVAHPFSMPVDWSLTSVSIFGFIVVFGTVFAFWAFMEGLRRISPVIAALLNCLEPLSAFLFSVLLLNDVLGGWQILGIALVLANVCLLALSKPKSAE